MISICVPTYCRPEYLRDAINSCVNQSFGDWELLIGDDSPNEDTKTLVEELSIEQPVRYFRHVPSLGQAANVQFLLDHAAGERLVLLHDDDMLAEGALERLNNVWSEDPTVDIAFGMQYLASDEGEVDLNASEALNANFHRTKKQAGLQASSVVSGLVAQIPNDCFMIRTDLARKIGYRSIPEVGSACDYDFGFRLGMQGVRVYFVHQYTAIYRLSKVSLARQGSDSGFKAYCLVKATKLPSEAESYRAEFLRNKAAMAIHGYLDKGNKKDAWRIVRSEDYSFRRLLSLGGLRILYRLLTK